MQMIVFQHNHEKLVAIATFIVCLDKGVVKQVFHTQSAFKRSWLEKNYRDTSCKTDQHMYDFKRGLVAVNRDCDLSYSKFAGRVRRYLLTMCRIWIRLGQKDHT